MLLRDHLLQSGLRQLRYSKPSKVRSLDLLTKENGTTEIIDQERTAVDTGANTVWRYVPDVDTGLRLVILQSTDPYGFPISRYEFEGIVSMDRRRRFPRTFPADFADVRNRGKQYVVDIHDIRSIALPRNLFGTQVTVISPRMVDNCFDLTMYCDAEEDIYYAVWIINPQHQKARKMVEQVTESLEQVVEAASHPLLLPALICNEWYELMADGNGFVHDIIRNEIQMKTDMMPGYFTSSSKKKLMDYDEVDMTSMHEQYDQIHKAIVEQHAYLSNGLLDFVKSFSDALKQASDRRRGLSEESTATEDDVRLYIERLVAKTRVEEDHHERLITKLNMQIQVLYTLMQQRDSRINIQIAEETKNDSSAMKTLALITVVFLPATAVASVFSMGAFINKSTTGGYNIDVSPHFWIYWAVVGPLTIVLLIAWILWINRRQLLTRREPRVHGSIDAADKKPQSRSEKTLQVLQDMKEILSPRQIASIRPTQLAVP